MKPQIEAIAHAQMVTGSEMQGVVPEKLSRPWLAHVIRLSAFPVAPWVAPADLWERVAGQPPETDQSQPRQLVRLQSGPWQEAVLQVAVNPLRIDWVAVPATRTDGSLGPDHRGIADMLPKFLETTRPWLTSTDFPIKRIALGLHGLLFADTKIAAYQVLQELLPDIKIDAERSSDFVYQINHPIPSRASVLLNRLTKWSSLAIQAIVMETSGAGSASVPVGHYASLECDHNTPAEHQEPLDPSLLGAIYDELAELACQNFEAGEIR
jgi:hypothetical protein